MPRIDTEGFRGKNEDLECVPAETTFAEENEAVQREIIRSDRQWMVHSLCLPEK